jgi:hypothetical protein
VVDSEGHGFKIDHDPAILDRARRKHGHVARWQLLELGVSQGLIQVRVETGKWVVVHKGVYCIGPRRNDPVSRAAAAVLACGPGAVLSHESAGSLWALLPRWSGPMEVTTKAKRTRPGITTHRCPSLEPRDVTRQHGVPTTTRARTVLDIAPALAKKLIRPFAETTTNPTNSVFEDDFLVFIEKYDLPTPQINVLVNGRRVDAYFPEHRLIVETDGWEFHKDQEAFEDDRDRDAENLRCGIGTVRITRNRFDATPDYEAARLQEIMHPPGPGGRSS